jgi:hypothetical protein
MSCCTHEERQCKQGVQCLSVLPIRPISAPLPPIESVAAMAWEVDPESLRAVSRGVTRA